MRNLNRLGVFVAATALAAPVWGQSVDGYMALTYDPGTETVAVFAYTSGDPDLAVYYNVELFASVYQNGTLVYTKTCVTWDGGGSPPPCQPSSEYDVELDDEIVAYPGSTYIGNTIHTVDYATYDDAYRDYYDYYYDPYGFDILPLLDNGGNFEYVLAPDVADDAYRRNSHQIARTHAQPATAPPPGLNVSQNGTPFVQNGQATVDPNCPGASYYQGTWQPNAGGTQLPCAFFTFTSDGTPQVPSLVAWFSNVNSAVPIQWQITQEFGRTDSACSNTNTFYNEYVQLQGTVNGSQQINVNSNFGWTSPGVVDGGVLVLTWQVGTSSAYPSYPIGLWGKDPTQSQVFARFQQNPGVPWYWNYILKWEGSVNGSPYHQFNDNVSSLKGTPNFGAPCGFGLMQEDPPGHVTGSTPIGDVWNWQKNVDSGIKEMISKQAIGAGLWRATMEAYSGDHRQVDGTIMTPTNTSKPGYPCAETVGSVTFCANPNLPVLTRSYADANGIKCYNGCNKPYLTYDQVTGWAFHESAYVPTLNTYIYYVRNVLTQQVP